MPATATASRTSLVTWIVTFATVALAASTVYFALDARAARRAAADARKAGTGGAVAAAPAADDRPAAGPSDEARRLRAENQMLLRRLLEQEAGGPPARPGPDGGALRTWMDRLEEMRKTDPARYKRVVERREQRRAEHESSMQEQLARLDQRLETLGNQETADKKQEAELLNKIAAVMSELSQLGDKMQALAQLPEAERTAQAQALAQQGRDLYNQLANLRSQDRKNQLAQLGSQLGLGADQTTQMTASVDRIVKDTDPRGMRPRGPGGPPGRRPP